MEFAVSSQWPPSAPASSHNVSQSPAKPPPAPASSHKFSLHSPATFLFMHLAKAGGANFADDLGMKRELGLAAGYRSCGGLHTVTVHSGNETSSITNCSKYLFSQQPICNLYACEGRLVCNLRLIRDRLAPTATVRMLLLVREPEALVVSMYAHCQQAGADGQRKHHYPKIPFGDWVKLWAEGRAAEAHRYCSYMADNAQTWKLAGTPPLDSPFPRDDDPGSPACPASMYARAIPPVNRSSDGGGQDRRQSEQQAIKQALSVVDTALVVGVTEAYKASLCLALLRGPVGLSHPDLAQQGCHCDPFPAPRSSASTRGSHTHGTNTSLIGIDGLTRARIRSLTWLDELLYARALARLERDLAALGWDCLLASGAFPAP